MYDGRSPSEAGGSSLRVLVELPRPALAEREDLEGMSEGEQRAYVRSLEREGAALRSALGARGVELRDAVAYGRAWDGFAATVDASDLAALSSLGVRALPVRRFYPATSEPVPVGGGGGRRSGPAEPPDSQDPIGDPRHRRARRLRLRRRSTTTTTRRPGATMPLARAAGDERHGAGGHRRGGRGADADDPRRRVRLGGRQEIHGTTDTLLAGLERAVDPDGDGAVDDAVRVALVGVNAPYAGLRRLAGGAGRCAARASSARSSWRPGATRGRRGRPTASSARPARPAPPLRPAATEAGAGVTARRRHHRRRASSRARRCWAGAPPSRSAPLAGPVTSTDSSALLRGSPSLGDRVALVRAGDNPVAQAAAAAGGRGQRGPPRRPPRPPAADAARRPRRRARRRPDRSGREGGPEGKGGREGRVRPRDRGAREGGGHRSPRPFSSRGPAFDGSPKPDLLAEGAAVTSVGLVTGTAVAAARLAVRAARLSRQRPAETPAGLREALKPPARAEANAPPAPAVPLGPVELTRSGDQVVGVRFALGAFERGDPLAGGSTIQPALRLELELVRPRRAPSSRRSRPPAAPATCSPPSTPTA